MFIVYHGSLDNPKSVGTNNLIKEGAKIVTIPEDIIINYDFFHKVGKIDNKIKTEDDAQDMEEEYKHIYKFVTKESVDLNDIVRKSNLALNEVIPKLTILELEGKIRKMAGNKYIRL